MPIYGNLVEITLENESFESIFNEFDTSIIYESDDSGKKSIMDRIKELFRNFVKFLKKLKIKIMEFFNKHFGLFKNKLDRLKKEEDKVKNTGEQKGSGQKFSRIEYKNYAEILERLSIFGKLRFTITEPSDWLTLQYVKYKSKKSDLEYIEFDENEIPNKFLEVYKDAFKIDCTEYNFQNIKQSLIDKFDNEINNTNIKQESIIDTNTKDCILHEIKYYQKCLNDIKKDKDESVKVIDSIIKYFDNPKFLSHNGDNISYKNYFKYCSQIIPYYKDLLNILVEYEKQYMRLYNLCIDEEWRFRKEACKKLGFDTYYKGDYNGDQKEEE